MNTQLNDDPAESIVATIGQLAVLPREEALARVREVMVQAEPSDEEIEALALSSGINKSDEHWGSRYYTELGSSLFRFARALLARYAAPQASEAGHQQRGGDVEAVLRLFLTGDGFIAECDIPHIVATLAAQPAASAETDSEVDMDEYRAMVAVMEQIDPATLPGLTASQRCALGRFAKPSGRQTAPSDENGGHRLVEPDHETALALADAPRSLRNYVAALRSALTAACDPDTIRALLAERDALREALEMMVEMVEMNGFGRDYAMDVARAALAQEQGDEQ